MTILTVRNGHNGIRRCDAVCHNAIHSDCDCVCGGLFHGASDRTVETARKLCKCIDEVFGIYNREQGELFE